MPETTMIAPAGNDDDRPGWKHRFQRIDEFQPIAVRHLKICDDDVDAPFRIKLEGCLSARGKKDFVARLLDDVCEDDAICLVVFDDEYTCHDADPFPGPLGGERLGE